MRYVIRGDELLAVEIEYECDDKFLGSFLSEDGETPSRYYFFPTVDCCFGVIPLELILNHIKELNDD